MNRISPDGINQTGSGPMLSPVFVKIVQCFAALCFVAAGLYLIFGQEKGIGILLVLVATVTCRLVIVDLPRWRSTRHGVQR